MIARRSPQASIASHHYKRDAAMGQARSRCVAEMSLQQVQRARVATSFFFLVNGAVVGSWVPFIPERARAALATLSRSAA